MTGAGRRLAEVRAVLARDGEPTGLYVSTSSLRSHAIVVPLEAIVAIDVEQRTITVEEQSVPGLASTAHAARRRRSVRQRLAALLGTSSS